MADNRQGGFGFGGGFEGFGGSSRYESTPAAAPAALSQRGSWGGAQAEKPMVKPLERIGGKWTEAELVAMVPQLLAIRDADSFMEDAFAGIGSRETPPEIQDEMTMMTREMESRGFRLRSGGADGADDAFEKGSTAGNKEIFVPKKGFNGRHDGILLQGEIYRRAQEMALAYHPNPNALFYDGAERRKPKFAAEAHTRNMGQMLGPNLDAPSKVVMAYTPDGAASGGTGQAIRVAESLGVPVLNMRRPAIREAVLKELGIERVLERDVQQARPMDAARDAARSRNPAPQEDRRGTGKPFDFQAIQAPEQRWNKSNASVFLKTTEKFGELSNMARGHGYRDGDVEWPSTEAQFQAMKFPDHPEIQEAIRTAGNAKLAKDVAYEHLDKVRPDWEQVNLQAMAYVLTRKHDASPTFRSALEEATAGGKQVVEWSRKSTFWGAAPDGSSLLGQNVLGRMLNQLGDGARMDDLPPGTKLIGKEAVPAVAVDAPARDASASQGRVDYRPGSDVSRMSADVIVNTVNANLSKASPDGSRQEGNPVMGAGVAKAFKERYGDAILRPYTKAILDGKLKAGGVQMLTMPDGQVIANLATKQDWRADSRMEWVESGLRQLAEQMKAAGHRSVALPPPGCGNGKLDWKEVEPLVLKHLKDFDVTITAAPSTAYGVGRGGEEMKAVEGRAVVNQAARDEARWRAGREQAARPQADRPQSAEPQMRTSMYFSYGRSRREGVQAASTFEAILSGERTSTTRFDNWQGSDRWGRLKPGAVVRMFEDKEMKGRHVDVRVTGVERIDLAQCSDARMEEWSKAEGWSTSAGRDYGAKNQPGWQVRYEPVPGQEILKQREREADVDAQNLAAAHGRRYGFGRS